MRFDLDNFLTYIKYIVPGSNRNADNLVTTAQNSVFTPTVFPSPTAQDGGIIVDIPLNLTAYQANTASGVTITVPSGTTGSMYISLGNTAGASTNAGYVGWTVPRDYDEASDQFSLRLMVNQAAQVTDKTVQILGQLTIANVQPNSSPTVVVTTTAAVYATTPFSSNAGTTVAANGAKITSVSPNVQVLELKFDGNGLKRDDVVTIFVKPTGTATSGDNLQIYSMDLTYASCLVSYNPTDGTGNFTNSVNPGGNMGQGVAPTLNSSGNSLR